MFESMNLVVSGRNNLVAEASAHEDGVIVQVNDNRDPAFWANIRISEQQLREMLTDVSACRYLAAQAVEIA